jgi:nitroreductase
MSNTLDVIAQRFTAREYTGEPVDSADLEKICVAGAQAPSSTNSQPWEIIAVTNPELIAELNAAGLEQLAADPKMERFNKSITERGGKLFYGAPVIIFVAIAPNTKPRGVDSAARDCGILVENLALAAASLGYGSCICGLATLPLDGIRGPELKEKLGFPEGWDFGIALLVGKTNSEATAHGYNPDKIHYIR